MAGMFSTKGRYALRIMGDLATHPGWVSLGDVAKRQGISRKYLEQVVSLLHRAGFVESLRGKGGGYRLTREPAKYTLGSILRAAEGSLAPVSCLDCTNDEICPQIDTCPTVTMWRDLGKVTASYLDSKTLADIVSEMEERGTAEAEAKREQSAENPR
ncbi:MAG: Rrf2 family transcriptional regulator [Olsenella sp.]|nr:Rrf2 family transcriptional regulator [Olsenella sp.]